MQLASTFSLFFSAALKLLLGFSQQLQKTRKNSNVLVTLPERNIPRALFLNLYDFNTDPNYYEIIVLSSLKIRKMEDLSLGKPFFGTQL